MFDPDLPSKVYLPTQLMNSNGGLAISNLRLFNSTTQDLGESPGYICLRDCEFESQYSTLDESFFPLICLKNVCLKRPKMAHLKSQDFKLGCQWKYWVKRLLLQAIYRICSWGWPADEVHAVTGVQLKQAFHLEKRFVLWKLVAVKKVDEYFQNLQKRFEVTWRFLSLQKEWRKLYCFLFRVRRP